MHITLKVKLNGLNGLGKQFFVPLEKFLVFADSASWKLLQFLWITRIFLLLFLVGMTSIPETSRQAWINEEQDRNWFKLRTQKMNNMWRQDLMIAQSRANALNLGNCLFGWDCFCEVSRLCCRYKVYLRVLGCWAGLITN